ncbi:MAG: phosphate signaling complex protein PhoU [Kurthia sp.]|nr:phosphate signaling complex protein PhoU [Candidatus Kurthia equi]
MVVREKYEQELLDVQKIFVDLCEMSIEAFEKAVDTFLQKDIERALMIIDQDRFINRLEEHIQDEVINLITRQQPVATDLRRLMVIVSAASDMERVGDYAVSIAKETIRLGKTQLYYAPEKILQLKNMAIKMLRDMLHAFLTEDLIAAADIAKQDDQMDQLYGHVMEDIQLSAKSHGANLEQVTQLSFICKHMERAADHATNLAEALFFLVKGKRYELNS